MQPDHKAASETSPPPQFDYVVYHAIAFTSYTQDIAIYDIGLRVDLSNSP